MVKGLKLDSEKPKIKKGFLEYFPRAIIEVAKLSEFGAKKYDWGNWQHVENGIERYSEAGVRHLLDSIIKGETDPESELLHATHEAWNALAKLELILRKKNDV